MLEKDVILTVYSCSAEAPCQQWAKENFEDLPIVINVGGQGGSDFRAKAIAWSKSGDAFQAALKTAGYKDVQVRRRGLTTFSVGWTFADELLKFESECQKLDAYLLLDGCHTQALDHWIKFATRAANMEAMMVMSHSGIKPPFVSSTVTNKKMFNKACEYNNMTLTAPKISWSPPDYILDKKLPAPITIALGAAGNLPAIKKTWTESPFEEFENRGDLTRLQYSGDNRPDHVFISRYVNKLNWRWLGESWAAKI